MLVLVTGGSGSGKSAFAENIAVSFGGERTYIAAMKVTDDESRRRVERHREMRADKGFVSVERYTDVKNLDACGTVILECMSNLLANEMFSPEGAQAKGLNAADEVIFGVESLNKKCDNVIVVTNEIFSDGIEYDEETRRYMSAYYPKDICEKIDEDLLRYGYPLYTSQSFWYYNTAEYPDGQPVTNWWQIVETNDDGSAKWKLFTKEVAQETAYMSLFASFIENADQMEQAYEDLYGEPLEYTYPTDGNWEFDFSQYENNAGVEFMWRFTQLAKDMVFIGDGDELVSAVHNSEGGPTLALASAGKIENREESGYDIDWLKNLAPYTGLENAEYLYVVENCPHPAGARLFIRWLTGDADASSPGLKPFQKTGNWPVRSDVEDKKNPASLAETGAIEPDLEAIYNLYLDAQDMWIQWLDIALNG